MLDYRGVGLARIHCNTLSLLKSGQSLYSGQKINAQSKAAIISRENVLEMVTESLGVVCAVCMCTG